MSKILHTALFVQKSTGKVIYRLQEKPLNKYFWEKAKVLKFDELAKDRWIDKWDIEVRDYGANQGE